MKRLHKPDFTKSNLNVTATVAQFLHAPNDNATLPYLTKELQKGYKNVVYICLDGLGMYPITKNLGRDDFLRRHIVKKLLSTFPSTTTNATTSLTTDKLPLEHGWFGWSLHFENIGKNINIFLNTDSWTDEPVDVADSPLAHFPYFFDTAANTDYEINTVFPKYVKVAHPERNNVFYGIDEFFDTIKTLCAKDGKQFVYAYCPEPDHSMHEFGVTCEHSHKLIEKISESVRNLESCADTLFIVTADHGQIDVDGYVYLYKDEKLMDMLNIYPYMEPRAVAFSVKDGKKEEFAKYFTEKYKKDFKLFESEKLVKKGYFGNKGDKANLLGDFVAVGTYTHKQAVLTPTTTLFKGHHTGLTEEMEVPLIVFGTRNHKR